jgi:hypothetical protein
MNEIPSSFYVIVGSLIVANIGTVVSIFYGIGKLVWWASSVEHRIKTIETEYAKDINEAHLAIRNLKLKE